VEYFALFIPLLVPLLLILISSYKGVSLNRFLENFLFSTSLLTLLNPLRTSIIDIHIAIVIAMIPVFIYLTSIHFLVSKHFTKKKEKSMDVAPENSKDLALENSKDAASEDSDDIASKAFNDVASENTNNGFKDLIEVF
jgi:hypothetical protein